MQKTETATYTCTRNCCYQGKYFAQGDPYPENWLKNGYQPGKHFAKTEEAEEIIRTGTLKTHVTCHGDDPRSNVELRAILKAHGIEDAESWTRKDMWEAVIGWEKAPAPKQSTGKEK